MRRTSFPVLFLFALLLSGCASSGMTSERQQQIPDGADKVILESQESPDALYRTAYQHLRKHGFRMSESNDEMHSLSTDGATVGKSKQYIRVDVFVERAQNGSRLTASADVRIEGFGWMDASKAGRGSEPRVGFEELVLLIDDLPHTEIRYQRSDATASR